MKKKQKNSTKKSGKDAKPKSSSKSSKPGPNTKRMIILAGIAILIILIAYYFISETEDYSYEKSIMHLNELDAKYGISMHDYDSGIVYLKMNPRYPNPINVDDFDQIIDDFEDLNGDTEDPAAELLVSARIHLLRSEKLYKLAVKTKKGITSDGFTCNDKAFVLAATYNFNSCVEEGRAAADELNLFVEKYPEHAESMNITKFTVKFLNSTYDYVEQGAKDNLKPINSFCE